MAESDRGIHPDLLEEEQAPAPAAETPSPPRRGRAARAAPPPSPDPAEQASPPPAVQEGESVSDVSPTSSEAETTEPPEWWQKVKDAEDPKAAFALLAKNLPKEEIERDPTMAGWLGFMGERRARELLRQQQQEAIEQQKREALANADFYGLGQMVAPDIQRQIEQSSAAVQGAPFMDGVTKFQSQLPPEVQQQVQNRTFAPGKSYAEGVAEYLDTLTQAAVSHQLTEAVEKEIKRREPALRKAWLSEMNGSLPVPELDGGQASSIREITDEQIDRMSLAEYDTYFNEQGRPRPGTRVRLTRGVPLARR